MERPRVLLGDDHQMFLEGLERMLSSRYEVVGKTTDGRLLVDSAKSLRPDLVVTDLTMPALNGLEVCRELLAVDGSWPIVLLTMHADSQIAESAFGMGVKAYMVKSDAIHCLEHAISEALRGRCSVSPSLRGFQLQRKTGARPTLGKLFDLTERQKEVLRLMVAGLALKEIAARLRISIKTVEFHKYSMMERLGTETRAGLLRYALVLGVTPALID